MNTYQHLQIHTDNHVARLVLNRPEQANAIDGTMWDEIGEAFVELDRSPDVRVIVLEGEGKHFCAGIDFGFVGTIVAQAQAQPEGRKQEWLREKIINMQESFSQAESCRKPVIAMVHGACVGAGLDLIAACDIRLASKDAHFCLKEADLGLVADIGSLQRLPKIIGEGRTRELAFTARKMDAEEAEQVHLINGVYDDKDQLAKAAMAMARTIAEKSPLTMRGVKTVMNYSRDHRVADGLDYVATWNAGMLLSTEAQEAVSALMERRIPRFD